MHKHIYMNFSFFLRTHTHTRAHACKYTRCVHTNTHTYIHIYILKQPHTYNIHIHIYLCLSIHLYKYIYIERAYAFQQKRSMIMAFNFLLVIRSPTTIAFLFRFDLTLWFTDSADGQPLGRIHRIPAPRMAPESSLQEPRQSFPERSRSHALGRPRGKSRRSGDLGLTSHGFDLRIRSE